LRDPDRDGGEEARGSLESQATSAGPEERAGPLDQVWADPFSDIDSDSGSSSISCDSIARNADFITFN